MVSLACLFKFADFRIGCFDGQLWLLWIATGVRWLGVVVLVYCVFCSALLIVLLCYVYFTVGVDGLQCMVAFVWYLCCGLFFVGGY